MTKYNFDSLNNNSIHKLYHDFLFSYKLIFKHIHSDFRKNLFQHSSLSLRFSNLDFKKIPIPKQTTAIEREVLMIKDTLSSLFGEDISHSFTTCL